VQADIRSPSHEDLVVDLKVVREKGLGNLRHYLTPAITVACRLYGAPSDDAHRPAVVEALLQEAVKKLGGGRSGEAASYTLGLVQGTRMWSATERRKHAARAQGVSTERFRKGYEAALLGQVAEGILALLYDHAPQSSAIAAAAAMEHDNVDLHVKNPGHAVVDEPHMDGADPVAIQGIVAANIRRFTPARKYYSQFRPGCESITAYVAQAKQHLVMVSINLMTGDALEDILETFRMMLLSGTRITLSLLDPEMEYLTLAVASSLNTTGDELSTAISRVVNKTVAFVSTLPEPQRANFALHCHATLPPASAILIDPHEEHGLIQLETKAYRTRAIDAFGFEVGYGSAFYFSLRDSYLLLVQDGRQIV
jgi:hypothetical protein